ncbi:hypothetical protein BS1321_25610 [Peribacillus simplex NBRC 15720 = DSM 1321]|uniref:Uncharacterized protein n=1 Tax=Peribacillus simplex NBRC 15720 = DSM 1321 TaxID=1349754 RepID=A0A223EP24_9BACI|nr:hypothetical protein BS1321_25610 [Peribacillus simplex NBRC 15720 = DSM 1321]
MASTISFREKHTVTTIFDAYVNIVQWYIDIFGSFEMVNLSNFHKNVLFEKLKNLKIKDPLMVLDFL